MTIISFSVKLNLKQEWKYVDFLWDNPEQKQKAIDSGDYDPIAIALFDVDQAPGKVIYIYLHIFL